MISIRMTGEANVINIKHGYLNIKDEIGADYMITAKADQLSGISLGNRVEVEIEWTTGKASSIRSIDKVISKERKEGD